MGLVCENGSGALDWFVSMDPGHGTGLYIQKLQKKHFTKMQKHVGLASTKSQPNKMGLT